ncbi:MAG: hypothetical protein K6F69_02510 [Treponema sp.]|nr:hypothetical protein [Treponema sp.]
MKLYLDMDGVLVNFRKQAEKYRLYIGKEGINWFFVFLMGKRFWNSMEWLKDAKSSYSKIENYCKIHGHEIYILSSVGFNSGKQGKIEWIKKHTNIPEKNIIIVKKSLLKKNYAVADSLLIDDRKKNIFQFIEAGGNALLFDKWNNNILEKIKEKLANQKEN